MKTRSLTTTAALSAVAVCAALVSASGAAAHTGAPGSAAPRVGAAVAAQVRVNQVGFTPTSAKTAFVMLPRAVRGVRFALESPGGSVYLVGRSSDDLGRWSASYGAVYELNFSAFRHPGS